MKPLLSLLPLPGNVNPVWPIDPNVNRPHTHAAHPPARVQRGYVERDAESFGFIKLQREF